MEHPAALNNDFNISTAESTTVRELAEVDLAQDQGRRAVLRIVSDPAYEYDVQKRVPDVEQGRRGARLRGARPRSTRCSTRSSPGSADAIGNDRI